MKENTSQTDTHFQAAFLFPFSVFSQNRPLTVSPEHSQTPLGAESRSLSAGGSWVSMTAALPAALACRDQDRKDISLQGNSDTVLQ